MYIADGYRIRKIDPMTGIIESIVGVKNNHDQMKWQIPPQFLDISTEKQRYVILCKCSSIVIYFLHITIISITIILFIIHIFKYVDSWQRQGTELPLQWPTEIVSNPVDGSLTIMDEGYLLVLSEEGVVYPLPISDCDNKEDTDRLVYNFLSHIPLALD